ncbi:hypothetical protein CJ030_MR3G003307 [Morella rubra]|uniref:Uncharacterized protein n=1 Tax=Morella rubra TaxID=262757 RepID=A0A6A1W9U5_9ROSI|nr:hypothetical protein CJ030_MR3G003307 [Morella rubra]
MAGNCIDRSPKLRRTAEKVAKECGGLAVAIVTIGSALRDKTAEYEWNAALQQLKKSIPQNIPGLHPKVYKSIEFSYNYIQSDEARSCFLLCCLFPEDYDIPIEDLVRYGVGRRLFAEIGAVAEARERVHSIVRYLRRSNLLLDSSRGEEYIRMHDIVRDVAISIASRDEHGFMVVFDNEIEEWPHQDTYESYAAISLGLRELDKNPDGLVCRRLQLLRLSYGKYRSEKFPGDLFSGMKELKALSLKCIYFKSLPPSIRVLENLRMLNLAIVI